VDATAADGVTPPTAYCRDKSEALSQQNVFMLRV